MGRKILTVDDSKTIRMIVARAFKKYDLEILEAQNGVEGLAVATREKPDLIILDYTMPIMDGFEMLTKLKSDPELKPIPVIMLTAEAGRENVMKIAKQGVRDYLIKPFKEELIIERVARVIDLKPRGESVSKVRRYDDALDILVVDDKPAIVEQIAGGLKETNWKVEGSSTTSQAIERCARKVPDIVLISLSLPENGAFTLFQMLRAGARTKIIPVFGLSVKTAAEDQARATQVGFTGIVTKPIDFEDVKIKITRALGLDTSFKYFSHKDGLLHLKLPAAFTPSVSNDIVTNLRNQLTEAVESGFDKMLIDMSAVNNADITLIKLGLSSLQLCNELGLKAALIGSPAVTKECRNYEETKDWRFVATAEEALTLMQSGTAVAA
ncbi:MAG TPA: response regulator [Verrucomicrobiales bacterium]|nr:response regulator [Verrucomicrobiales bacterium]